MNNALIIFALVPSALSVCALIVNIVLTAKKESRRDKDVAWDMAKEMTLRSIVPKEYWIDREREEVIEHFTSLYESFLAARGGYPCKSLKERESTR